MSDIARALNIDPSLSRMASADAAMVQAKSKLSAAKLKEIDQSSKEFESMFISEMLQPMFETVQTDNMFGGGQGEDTWKSMMVDQYAKKISDAGGIGLADSIKAKMIEMQEAAQTQGSLK
jgi:Rod binding domain-containing protein